MPTEVSNVLAAVQAATCSSQTPASWVTWHPRPGHVKSYPVSSTQHFSQIALLQECDDGEAAKKALLQLGKNEERASKKARERKKQKKTI